MKRLSATDVHSLKVAELGLDSTALDLNSTEAIAGALRRAASFLCPCSSATLIRSVVHPLRGLTDDMEATKIIVEDTLEALTAHGDLLEHPDVEDDSASRTTAQLYTAPASFVVRKSGTVILLGITSDQCSTLPDDLQSRVKFKSHLRLLMPVTGEDLRNDLHELGFVELSYEEWLRMPKVETADDHLVRLDRVLDAVQPSRDVPGLVILDPAHPAHYYRGRWMEAHSHSGRFVARRSQAYGAKLWCYIQLRDGNPERLIDFPIVDGRWRGCDEAWRLQMAIDARRGNAQRFRVRSGSEGMHLVQFFSPVPKWARRRWNAVGEPVSISGCLFAYRFSDPELIEELSFARRVLWLEEVAGSVQ